MSAFSWLWHVDRPADPEHARPLNIQRDRALADPDEPFDYIEDRVRAIDAILRRCVGRPQSLKRADELLDQRNGLREARPAPVPVIPGRSS